MDAVVGRDTELAAVTAFLDLGESRSTVLLLEGEAGIGKTTVWTESTRAASKLGYRVLRAQPLVAETPISFAAVGDLLAGVLDEVVAELPDPQRRALEVALLLDDPDGPPPELQAIAFAFTSALRMLAGSRPTLVAVDDIQWLDPASASVLLYAARRVGAEPIRLLLAGRPGGIKDVARGLGTSIDGASLESISLGPLSLGALQSMFHAQLGHGFARPILHRIYVLSERQSVPRPRARTSTGAARNRNRSGGAAPGAGEPRGTRGRAARGPARDGDPGAADRGALLRAGHVAARGRARRAVRPLTRSRRGRRHARARPRLVRASASLLTHRRKDGRADQAGRPPAPGRARGGRGGKGRASCARVLGAGRRRRRRAGGCCGRLARTWLAPCERRAPGTCDPAEPPGRCRGGTPRHRRSRFPLPGRRHRAGRRPARAAL